jgi:signal peptidase II
MRWSRGWFAGPPRDAAVPGLAVSGPTIGRPPVTRNGLTLLGTAAALVVLIADQASKWWILDVVRLPDVGQIVLLPVLNLTMVWNRGVTFGLLTDFGQWSYLLLAAVALAVIGALVIWLRRAESRLVAIALGAIVGGALSNVVDRLRFGAVVDFIHAHLGAWSWYVFNLADAAIVCGVAALVVDGMLPGGRRARSAG